MYKNIKVDATYKKKVNDEEKVFRVDVERIDFSPKGIPTHLTGTYDDDYFISEPIENFDVYYLNHK